MPWHLFPWIYALLLIAICVAVYLWDTRWRGGDPVAGTRGGYFGSQWLGGWLCASPWIIMTKGGPVNSTLFYVYYLFNTAFRYLHMGYDSAMGWVLFVLVCALTFAQMQSSKRWVHYEGD